MVEVEAEAEEAEAEEAEEADGADGADGDGSEYKVSEVVKTVRTRQNSLGQNGTHLGLILLHVGPNGDGFGGQTFMEHYTTFEFMLWQAQFSTKSLEFCGIF
jgi:hypothetical protein